VSGDFDGALGPFVTHQPLLILDITLPAGADASVSVSEHLDTAMVYCRSGSLSVNGRALEKHGISLLNAKDGGARRIDLTAGSNDAGAILFAGRRLNQPIAWHGPVVMTTEEEVRQTFREIQSGRFPPTRTAWDFKKLSAFPADHPARRNE
jgi:hypothetical protein